MKRGWLWKIKASRYELLRKEDLGTENDGNFRREREFDESKKWH